MLSVPSLAMAQEPIRGRPIIGLRSYWLHPVKAAGGLGADPVEATETIGVQPYVDWQFTDVFAVGVGVPMTANSPGPDSNGYDIGVASRIRLGYPKYESVYPYVVASMGPTWLRVPQKVSLRGLYLSANAGVSFKLTHVLSFIVELGYQYTSFSGNMPISDATSPPSPIYYGTARVSFLSAGGGLEVRL